MMSTKCCFVQNIDDLLFSRGEEMGYRVHIDDLIVVYEFSLFRPWQISDSIVGSTFCLSAESASYAMSSNMKYEIPQFCDVVDAILM